MSSSSHLDYPDFAVLDLDPAGQTTYQDACAVALVLKQVLMNSIFVVGQDLWCHRSAHLPAGKTRIHL